MLHVVIVLRQNQLNTGFGSSVMLDRTHTVSVRIGLEKRLAWLFVINGPRPPPLKSYNILVGVKASPKLSLGSTEGVRGTVTGGQIHTCVFTSNGAYCSYAAVETERLGRGRPTQSEGLWHRKVSCMVAERQWRTSPTAPERQ